MIKVTKADWQARIDAAHGKNTFVLESLGSRSTKSKIRCASHGVFLGSVSSTANGGLSCSQCRTEKTNDTKLDKSFALLLTTLKSRHSGRVAYVKGFVDLKSESAVFNCVIHGRFTTSPKKAISNISPCKKCRTLLIDETSTETARKFSAEVRRYAGRYVFHSAYSGVKSEIGVTCVKHGVDFNVVAGTWLGRSIGGTWRGCPKCVSEFRHSCMRKSDIEFQTQLSDTHDSTITTLGAAYAGSHERMKFKCVTCGHVWQTIPDSVVRSTRPSGCPKCCGIISVGEQELFDWVKKLCPDAEQSVRTVYSRRLGYKFEWDIYVPSKSIALEYNGLYFHSYPKKPKFYHQEKTQCSRAAGVKLIHVYEDDWERRSPVVKRTLRYLLGCNSRVFYARKLELVRTNTLTTARSKFFENFHMLGAPNSGISYALRDGAHIKALMTFSKVNSERGANFANDYELTRFASNGQVVGGASRLLKAFLRDFNPARIISYSDNDMFEGGLYEILGFKKIHDIGPDYKSVWSGQRRHKSYTRRSNLVKLLGPAFDADISEMENLIQNKILVLFDSGKVKWEWKME